MQLSMFNGANVRISPSAIIGHNVRIGDNTVIYDNVTVGDDTTICNDCVLGEPLNDYYAHPDTYENPPLVIGAGSLVRSHAILYAGSRIGDHFQCGHRVTIREGMRIGSHCRVGTLCDLQGHAEMGDYTSLHSNVHIGQRSTIGNYCWIFPYTVLINDPTPPSHTLIGPTVGDYSIVAAGCLLMPGVKVGTHSLVGAHSLVARDIPDYGVAVNNPAKVVRDVHEVTDPDTGAPHYPWPHHFDRGMPWEGMDYEAWLKQHHK